METRTKIEKVEKELENFIKNINGLLNQKIEMYLKNKKRFSEALINFFKKKGIVLSETKTKEIGSELGLIAKTHLKGEKKIRKLHIKLEIIEEEIERKIKENEAIAFKLLGDKIAVKQTQENIGDINISYTEEVSKDCSDLSKYIEEETSIAVEKLKEDFKKEVDEKYKKYMKDLEELKKEWRELELKLIRSELTQEEEKKLEYLRKKNTELLSVGTHNLFIMDKQQLEIKLNAEIKKLHMQVVKNLANNTTFRKSLFDIVNKSLFLGIIDIRGQNIVIDKKTGKAVIVDLQKPETRPDFEEFDCFIDKLKIKKFQPILRFDREFFTKIEGIEIESFIVDLFALNETSKSSGSLLSGASIFYETPDGYLYDIIIESLKTPTGKKEFINSMLKTIDELIKTSKIQRLNQEEMEELILSLKRVNKINEIIRTNFDNIHIVDDNRKIIISETISLLSERVEKIKKQNEEIVARSLIDQANSIQKNRGPIIKPLLAQTQKKAGSLGQKRPPIIKPLVGQRQKKSDSLQIG